MPRNASSSSRSDELSDESEEVPYNATSISRGKGKEKATDVKHDHNNIIVQTAFDSYFNYNKSGRVQTSSNVFSQLVLPLSPEEFTNAIASASKDIQQVQPNLLKDRNRCLIFSRIICELNEGFNVLCYGMGSKRRLLNEFATSCCSRNGHVVIANGFQPDFSVKDLLNSIENLPFLQELNLTSTAMDKQAQRIYDVFGDPSQKLHLYIVIHNIDAAPLRSAKAKSILALLAYNPRIHITASIDHINAPLLWSSSEMVYRKPDKISTNPIPSRGFAWLWHDLTTLAPYDFELAFADRSSLSGAHTGGARRKTDTLAAQNAIAMSETAAAHILACVTQKAQKLFTLLGNYQLDALENGEDSAAADLQQYGMAYDLLFTSVRDNFIATSDTALRALLGEFRDHSLIVSGQGTTGGGEILWIPMRKERLANVLRTLT